jgi:excinuclease ABC subunit C
MFDIKTFLANLTNHPGIYQMLDEDGKVLYVGKAKNLKKRVTSYFNPAQQDLKTLALIKHVKSIDITITRSENEALILECNLIKKNKPRYNILFRDDKSYPYILITNEKPYPRIDFYRGALKKDGRYFGPYPSASAVRETIHLIQKVFQLRTCSDNFFTNRMRPCLHHQIGLCSGSCVGLLSEEEYQQNVYHAVLFLQGKNQLIVNNLIKQMEDAAKNHNFELAARIRDQLAKIREIQERQYVSSGKGDADILGLVTHGGVSCIQLLTIRAGRILGSRGYFPSVPSNSTNEEILTAFITQHYLGSFIQELPKEIIIDTKLTERDWLANGLSEIAKHKIIISNAVRGERRKWLEMAISSAQQSVNRQLLNKANTQERLLALQQTFALQKLPTRIECFDISHTMGEATVAACVVFDSNGLSKSDYRRFNISDITPGDDIGAMRSALLRRYKSAEQNENKLPDIVLIDGGLAQLHAAEKVFADLSIHQVILIGVAKGVARKPGFETLHIPGKDPLHLAPDSLTLHLIQYIRDEAHRFAISGHRNRRAKIRRTSTLEAIPGIGAKRRRELLRYFGGIQALNRASLDELTKVPGISQSLAERIFEVLHDIAV